jgi:hypothetical protein
VSPFAALATFPMLEQLADMAGDLIRFADSLGRTSLA